MHDANSNSDNTASVPVSTKTKTIDYQLVDEKGTVHFLITARCGSIKKDETCCDHKIDVDCLTPDTCYAVNIIKAEVHDCPCSKVN